MKQNNPFWVSMMARVFEMQRWLILRKLQIAGALAIVAVVWTTFHPALPIGFWTDDYIFAEAAGRLSVNEYFALYFDPWIQVTWYRPVQGIQWRVEYSLFHGDPLGYHFVQIIFHAINSLLLYAVTSKIVRNWRIGVASALVFAALPITTSAVFWLAVPDPLASVFYLLSLRLWISHLESRRLLQYMLAFVSFVIAILSKEMAATLPVTLLLADRWVVNEKISLTDLTKRYFAFGLVMLVYAFLEFHAVTQGVFARDWGYSIGINTLAVLVQYLARIVFPWGLDPPLNYVWLLLLGALSCFLGIRNRQVFFLAVLAILVVLPVVPFQGVSLRYMYLPAMISAVGVGLLAWFVLNVFNYQAVDARFRFFSRTVTGVALALLFMWGSATIGESAEGMAGIARQTRLKFRPVFQRHPDFAPGTFLYFIHPPFTSPNVSGMMFLRYGSKVSAYEISDARAHGLRNHPATYVFYLDDQDNMREQMVAPEVEVRVAPQLPVRLGESFKLEGIDWVSADLRRDDSLIMLLYWRVLQKIDRDYMVFTHLIDKNGETIAGTDQPLGHNADPSNHWKPNDLIVDAIVLPVDRGAPAAENLRLEVGVYDSSSAIRLLVFDASGAFRGDAILAEPFRVVP